MTNAHRRALLSLALVATLAGAGAPASALRYEPASPRKTARFEAALGGQPGVEPLGAGLPPAVLGSDPFVTFVDLAWTARHVHLVLRNASGSEAQVRVTYTRRQPGGPDVRTTEGFAIAPGAAAHPVYEVDAGPGGFPPLGHVIVASDRPLLVSARAFGSDYAHELRPVGLDCADSGDAQDDGTPYGLLCWIAKHD